MNAIVVRQTHHYTPDLTQDDMPSIFELIPLTLLLSYAGASLANPLVKRANDGVYLSNCFNSLQNTWYSEMDYYGDVKHNSQVSIIPVAQTSNRFPNCLI